MSFLLEFLKCALCCEDEHIDGCCEDECSDISDNEISFGNIYSTTRIYSTFSSWVSTPNSSMDESSSVTRTRNYPQHYLNSSLSSSLLNPTRKESTWQSRPSDVPVEYRVVLGSETNNPTSIGSLYLKSVERIYQMPQNPWSSGTYNIYSYPTPTKPPQSSTKLILAPRSPSPSSLKPPTPFPKPPASSKPSPSSPKPPTPSKPSLWSPKPSSSSSKPSSSSSTPSSSSSNPLPSLKPTLSPVPSYFIDQKGKGKYSWADPKDTFPIYNIPKDIEELIKRDIVPEVLEKALSPSTYQDYFAALLYAEDYYIKVLFEGNSSIKKVILNRPKKLNAISYEMICQMLTNFQAYEQDSTTNFVILKSNGRAFCAGGDVVATLGSMIIGHWSFGANFHQKLYTLDYLLATYKKPLISLINGVVMGGGAGLSVHAKFRIVTDNAVFAMPEASIGLFAGVGASYFLSRLPGYFGEYLGLTGARLDGMEMLACGLATHFVLAKDLVLLENELDKVGTSDTTEIARQIERFSCAAPVKRESAYARLDIINKCFSKNTVEDILLALGKEMKYKAEKWIIKAIKSMEAASPTSLKIFLRSIRKGREQTLERCLSLEYIALCNIIQGSISKDYYEGGRAKLIEKDNKPKWEPSNLQSVSEERVNRYFTEVDDPHWEILRLPDRPNLVDALKSKM